MPLIQMIVVQQSLLALRIAKDERLTNPSRPDQVANVRVSLLQVRHIRSFPQNWII